MVINSVLLGLRYSMFFSIIYVILKITYNNFIIHYPKLGEGGLIVEEIDSASPAKLL